METPVIAVSDQEPGENKENSNPDVKFAQKAPDDMRQAAVKYISKMRYKNQVSSQRAHPC